MTALLERPPARERARRALRRHRILLGCLIALLCGAAIGGVFVEGQVLNLKSALSQNQAVSGGGQLQAAGFGDAETFLLVGDDQRKLTGIFKHYSRAVLPHSNEMILARVDPNLPYISLMSIPRELKVQIRPPGQRPVTTRFNYAYTAGGIPLLVSTIHRELGVGINHVMVVTFAHFQRAIDQMGCVYTTIDRRYFHVNVPGGEQYQEVDLQPGYQRLCGKAAVQFVSYRHGDDSIVRDARDQRLLLDVKQQYGPSLAGNLTKFEDIFGRAVQTDAGLHSAGEIVSLANTLVASSARAVRQVHFQVDLTPSGPNPCGCVTASRRQIRASVDSFLHGPPPHVPQKASATHAAAAVRSRHALAKLPLVPIGGVLVASARDHATRVPMAYEFPAVQDRGGAGTPVALRDYVLHAPGGRPYPAYVAVFAASGLGQFYDVQGTTWSDPPLLSGPHQTVQAGRRTLQLYWQSGQLETLSWHENGATYWVRNTLTQALSPGEMLAIAEQTRALHAVLSPQGRRSAVSLRTAAVRYRAASTPANLRETIGGIAGLVSLLMIAALGVLALRRRRVVAELRDVLDAHVAREGRLRAVLARRMRRRGAPPPGGTAAGSPARPVQPRPPQQPAGQP